MHRGFGGTAFEPVEEGRDREITLGPVMLAVLGLALLALCSLCFIGGYSVGRGHEQAAAAPSPAGPSAAELLRDAPKPAASASNSGSQPAPQAAAALPAQAPAQASAAASTGAPAANPSGAATTPAPSVVHAALPAQGAAVQPGSPGGAVQTALPQSGAWMVQIAAVSHSEDADVLVAALRQRGYWVSTRHDPADNLIHVQIGPFSAYNDAVGMRQRLLNDGYNAVIQP